MPRPLVECIPNFSDARRPDVIDKIVDAIRSVPGVHMLDRHSDLDHNRTVITIVGDPVAVEEAAFLSIKKASELINLDEHTGAHPRVGATDVVPFVPISEITMPECVEMARRLGKRVGVELSIPVYLYEDAATRPDRQNLENIRKGQYEGLKTDILSNPDRKPDFGPEKLGSAGATVIGARAPLIAFNVYLTTTDITIAQKIAKAMRNSSGGFRFVKAMGVVVDGRAQVSMNLTNFRQTPVARIVEAVRREAERYGVTIQHSELVGLIPQDAMIDAAVWYTQLDDFKHDQLLENRLFELMQTAATDKKGPSFLDQLASADPTPGGGSAAAYTGATAAALVAMVGRVTSGKKKYADVEPQMAQMIQQAENLRARLTKTVDEDARSFEGFIQATRLPKETPDQQTARTAAMESATKEAARVPHQAAQMCVEVLELAITAATLGNTNAISDAVSAAQLAIAALKSASVNVRINAKSLSNPAELQNLVDDTLKMAQKAKVLEEKVLQALSDRAGIQ
ncbi:MAG: glutamate formimidoyltransferase [Anaerolinea sp.]|nr:glutamate formimidoyltransferase [Anaerolinea sp.]